MTQLHHPSARPSRQEAAPPLRLRYIRLHILHPHRHRLVLSTGRDAEPVRTARRDCRDLPHIHRLCPFLRTRQLGTCIGGIPDSHSRDRHFSRNLLQLGIQRPLLGGLAYWTGPFLGEVLYLIRLPECVELLCDILFLSGDER